MEYRYNEKKRNSKRQRVTNPLEEEFSPPSCEEIVDAISSSCFAPIELVLKTLYKTSGNIPSTMSLLSYHWTENEEQIKWHHDEDKALFCPGAEMDNIYKKKGTLEVRLRKEFLNELHNN